MKKDSWNIGQYEKFKEERSQPFFDLLDFVQGTPKKVIDLGCGSGELTNILHQRTQATETTGIDTSANMLAKAPKEIGLLFQQANIEDLTQFGKFDLIFSNAAIQWCPNHPKLFQNIRESLNPNGQIAIQMPMNHDYPTHVIASEMALEEPYKSWLPETKEGAKIPVLAPEAYANLLFALGFQEQIVTMKVYGHVLASRQAVVEWVKGTLLTRYQSQLTTEQFSNFLDDFRNRLFQKIADEKPFFYPFKRVLIWGKIS